MNDEVLEHSPIPVHEDINEAIEKETRDHEKLEKMIYC
tara:strand:- start:72 stop:185 length:114 start_codon:yes stop_codon:yes gene_type:complete